MSVISKQQLNSSSKVCQGGRGQPTDLYKYSIQMPYLLFTANHIV